MAWGFIRPSVFSRHFEPVLKLVRPRPVSLVPSGYTPKSLDLDEFPEMRDTKDSPILATAIMEGIDVFLTGDKDFLVLDVEMPEIMTMAEFLQQY